jgi:ketosteroid isomerase-like protein
MSTTTASVPVTRDQVETLVAMVREGRILDAFERFYADDVVMQENRKEPTVGKAANREREAQFVAYVKEVHANEATAVAVDGAHVFIAWTLDFTGVDGARLHYEQVAQQEWRDGKIVRERFVYDPTSLVHVPGFDG